MQRKQLERVTVKLREEDGKPVSEVRNPKTRELLSRDVGQTWDELISRLDYYRGPNKDREVIIEEDMPNSAKQYFAALELSIFGKRQRF